jgi:hypothetical protein
MYLHRRTNSICFAYIKFRHAWKAQGHTIIEELPFSAAFEEWGRLFNVLVLILMFYAAGWPRSIYSARRVYIYIYHVILFGPSQGRKKLSLTIPSGERNNGPQNHGSAKLV